MPLFYGACVLFPLHNSVLYYWYPSWLARSFSKPWLIYLTERELHPHATLYHPPIPKIHSLSISYHM
jgi:hypothetical protein